MKEDFDRCVFVVAKEEGGPSTKEAKPNAVCRDRLACTICQYCSKHCVEHIGLTKVVADMAVNKRAQV